MGAKIGFVLLAAVCVVFFAIQMVMPAFTDALVLNHMAIYEPWRYVTAIFLHGGIGHLAYNMFALILFGFMLESIIGTRKFMITFFASGIIANIIAGIFYNSSLGASGAIFGIIGTLVILRPKMAVWAFGMPMPLFIAGLLWATGDIIGAGAYFAGTPMDNTGNIAHLVGMFVGAMHGLVVRKNYTNTQGSNPSVEIDEQSIRIWEDNYIKK